jgi:hypothetical protein
VENSLAFYQALRKAKVPAELHVYQDGPHGVGLAPGQPGLETWKDRLADWLKNSGFLVGAKERAAVDGVIKDGATPIGFGSITFESLEYPSAPPVTARIRNGKYSLPKNQGPIQGNNRIRICNMGTVEPRPTIEDVAIHENNVVIKQGQNTFDVGL